MEIKNVLVKDIKYAPYNPRKISDEVLNKLKKSIEEFGYVEPIIVNKRTMHVVGGNQRLKVLRQMGIGEVQSVIVDLDETHEKALNIALNKINGEWDLPALKDLLLEIDTGEIDIELTGFEMPEIEELMNQFHIEGEEDNFNVDEAVEEIKEPTTKTGDIWLLGKHRVMCVDATKKEDVERLMDGVKADMVLTDPPYGMNLDTDFSGIKGSMKRIGRKNHTQGNKYNKVIGDNEDFAPKLITTIFNNFGYCKEMFLFGADYYAELLPNKNDGSWLVWDKRKESQADAIGSEFELCWSKQKHKRRILRHDWFGFLSSENTYDARHRVHPTQKPITLLVDIINQWGKSAKVIIDIYGGSGSTLIACEQLNRICYMMEIDPVYCDVIVKRWEEYTGKKAELLR
jgi:DNA modification methylase